MLKTIIFSFFEIFFFHKKKRILTSADIRNYAHKKKGKSQNLLLSRFISRKLNITDESHEALKGDKVLQHRSEKETITHKNTSFKSWVNKHFFKEIKKLKWEDSALLIPHSSCFTISNTSGRCSESGCMATSHTTAIKAIYLLPRSRMEISRYFVEITYWNSRDWSRLDWNFLNSSFSSVSRGVFRRLELFFLMVLYEVFAWR